MKTRFGILVMTISIALILGAGAARGAIPASERDALIAVYDATGGPAWNNSTNWLGAPGTECTWHGVMCDPGENNVEELVLPFNNLVGPLPAEIDDLTMLRVMVLAFNGINESLPPEIFNMSQLENIEMASNNLTGSLPPEIGNLTNLHNLDFNWNQHTGSLPPEMGNLTNLHALRLGDNLLEGPVPPELGNLVELRGVDLWGNQLTGTLPAELANLTQLESFSIDRNQLSGEIPAYFGSFPNLNWLNLESNEFTGPIPPELGSLPNLGTLRLNHNHLSGPIPPELGNLANLVEIFLEDNMLNGPIPPELGNLANLERLSAGFNRLEGTIPPELGNATNLRSLFIDQNHLSGSLPSELGNLVHLEELHLTSNAITGDIPATITNLVALWDDSNGIDFNGVYTNDPGVGGFMDTKFGGGWRGTQTVPPDDLAQGFITGIAARLVWTPIAYQWDEGGYSVHVAANINGPYDLVSRTLGKQMNDWVLFDLAPSTTYYVKLRTVTEPHPANQNTVVSDLTEPLTVTTTADPSTWYAATTGVPGNDCATPGTPCPSVQEAILRAAHGEQVLVAPGTYSELLDIPTNIKIAGTDASTTVVDGNGGGPVVWLSWGRHAKISGLTIRNGTFDVGGCVHQVNHSVFEFSDGVIADCQAFSWGGGIFTDPDAGTRLDRVEMINNTAGERGGAVGSSGGSHIEIIDSTISGNNAPWGGGLYSTSYSNILRTTFDGNTASDFGGGGIVNSNVLTVSDSSIVNNSAAHGGGIANTGGGDLNVSNSTISGNTGGGLFNDESSRARLESSTIAYNAAPFTEHSGLMNWNELHLHNTIVAGNAPYNCANPITSMGYNLDDDATCGLETPGDVSGVDPVLGPLADNGGSTFTHALTVGSPAIDAADPTDFPPSDQRGWGRPLDGDADSYPMPDIGAVEYAGVVFADGFESGDLSNWPSSVP